MSAHQPDHTQKPGSQMLDHAPGPRPLANTQIEINIQQNPAKSSPSHTSNSTKRPQPARKLTRRPTGDLLMKRASEARKNGVLCCCCTVCLGFVSIIIGTLIGCLTSWSLCLCRCLNQTTLLGCIFFPLTMLGTWAAGFLHTINAVMKYALRYIGFERMMIAMCSCTSAGVGSTSLLDLCNCFCNCCCQHDVEDDCICYCCGCKDLKLCEKEVLGEPRYKFCIYQEDDA